jgi:hypothetical protein
MLKSFPNHAAAAAAAGAAAVVAASSGASKGEMIVNQSVKQHAYFISNICNTLRC